MEIRYFDSMYELGQALDQPHAEGYRSSHRVDDDGWNGELSMDDCKRACEQGGRSDNYAERLNDLIADLPDHDYAQIDQVSLQPSVQGFMPMIPEYLAGEPEQMLAAGFAPRDTPTREIVINCSASASVEADEILGRCAAVVHLVEEMELKGIRCGITIGAGFKGSQFHVETRVRVKRPEDVFQRDTATLALGSPEMLRRLMFNLLESSEEFKANPSLGYGRPVDIAHSETDLYITGCYDHKPLRALEQIRESLA